MADPHVLAQMLESSASGGWDEPVVVPAPPPRVGLGAYLSGLPARAMIGFGETGRLMGNDPDAYRRTTPIVGDALLAKDAFQNKDWWGAGLYGLSAVGDLAGAGGKAAKAGVLLKDLPYLKWAEDLAAHPALLEKQKSAWVDFLQKQAGVKNPKPESKATLDRAAKAEALAKARHPEPPAPGGKSADEAKAMLDTMGRTWPGAVLAGTGATAGASGVPGVVLDDINAQLPRNARDIPGDYYEPEKMYRLDDPHIRKIHDDMERTNAVLTGHIGAGAAASALMPSAVKLGARATSSGAFVGTPLVIGGLGLATHGPVGMAIGLPMAALGAAPAVVPWLPAAGLGYGAWKAAQDTGPLYERAAGLADILKDYGRRGEDRFGPDAQSRYPREGY